MTTPPTSTQRARLSRAEIVAIRERAEAATSGPWLRWVGPFEYDHVVNHDDTVYVCQQLYSGDAAFIAAARTDVPRLCDELEAAREVLEAALPLLRTHSCWHDDPPELDCCEYGLVAEQASVVLGNEPLPIYAAYLRSADGGDADKECNQQ